MGVKIMSMSKNCCSSSNDQIWNTQPTIKPDPILFNIIKMEQVGYNIVIFVNYPTCTNYEGNKICVYKSADFHDFVNMKMLDPHFSDNNTVLSPFARFEPTAEGWDFAVNLAKEIV